MQSAERAEHLLRVLGRTPLPRLRLRRPRRDLGPPVRHGAYRLRTSQPPSWPAAQPPSNGAGASLGMYAASDRDERGDGHLHGSRDAAL